MGGGQGMSRAFQAEERLPANLGSGRGEMGHEHGRMFKEWVWPEWLGLGRSLSGRELGCLLRVQGSHGRGRGRKGSSVDPWIGGGWRLEGGGWGRGRVWPVGMERKGQSRRGEEGRGLPASEPHLRWRAQEGGCV